MPKYSAKRSFQKIPSLISNIILSVFIALIVGVIGWKFFTAKNYQVSPYEQCVETIGTIVYIGTPSRCILGGKAIERTTSYITPSKWKLFKNSLVSFPVPNDLYALEVAPTDIRLYASKSTAEKCLKTNLTSDACTSYILKIQIIGGYNIRNYLDVTRMLANQEYGVRYGTEQTIELPSGKWRFSPYYVVYNGNTDSPINPGKPESQSLTLQGDTIYQINITANPEKYWQYRKHTLRTPPANEFYMQSLIEDFNDYSTTVLSGVKGEATNTTINETNNPVPLVNTVYLAKYKGNDVIFYTKYDTQILQAPNRQVIQINPFMGKILEKTSMWSPFDFRELETPQKIFTLPAGVIWVTNYSLNNQKNILYLSILSSDPSDKKNTGMINTIYQLNLKNHTTTVIWSNNLTKSRYLPYSGAAGEMNVYSDTKGQDSILTFSVFSCYGCETTANTTVVFNLLNKNEKQYPQIGNSSVDIQNTTFTYQKLQTVDIPCTDGLNCSEAKYTVYKPLGLSYTDMLP